VIEEDSDPRKCFQCVLAEIEKAIVTSFTLPSSIRFGVTRARFCKPVSIRAERTSINNAHTSSVACVGGAGEFKTAGDDEEVRKGRALIVYFQQ